MKARFFKNVSFGLALSALPFVAACNQVSNAPQSLITSAQAEPLSADATNAVLSTNRLFGTAAPETMSAVAAVAAPAPNAGKSPLPPNLKPSSAAAEVAKLAQSGVDENVMLTYVANSGSLFALGSDEIIYLNDLGVPDAVITAMIQHDQSLKQTWAETAQAQNATAQSDTDSAQASAPSYVNPPQSEPEPVAAGAPAPVQQPVNVTYNYFYDSLSPYGTWIDVDGYGRCWQPTVVVVNRGWRPYCDGGRWLYSDSGWYWYSDYTWGWAPFHYGRWFSHPTWGWCWYPGYTWAPAWVSWRYNSGYCGWAPLPPAAVYTTGIGFTYYGGNVGVSFGFGLSSSCYSFVPWSSFCGYRPYKHCVPRSQAQQIYQNSTVINNYINGDNNTIINRGVPIDHARQHSRSEIRQVALRETPSRAAFGVRGEQLDREGRTLAVYRPNIPQSSGVDKPSQRSLRDPDPGRMPVAGAGAAAQLQPSRGQLHPRPSADARSRSALPLTTSTRPADNRTVNQTQTPLAPSSNSRVTSPTARSTPADAGNTTWDRSERRSSSGDSRPLNNNRPVTAAPLILKGDQRTGSTPPSPVAQRNTTVNAPMTQKSPAGSLVVIGRRDSGNTESRANLSQNRSTPTRAPRTWSAPQTSPTSRPSMPTLHQITPSARTFSTPVTTTTSPRIQSVTPTYNATRSTPAPIRSMPSYKTSRSTPASSVTVIRSSPTPTPSYSAPRSSVSYSAPRSSVSHNAPRSSVSHNAPRSSVSYSAPRSSVSHSAPRSPSSPAPSYRSAPSRSSSSPSPSPMRSDAGRSGSFRRN